MKIIYLAGGCFWGVEAYIKTIPGVINTEVGYANGLTQHPSYEDVCHHGSAHAECVEVTYDETLLTLTTLLEKFFMVVDPTTRHRQGPDVGSQYRSGVYYVQEEDVPHIRAVLENVQKEYSQPLVVEVVELIHFFEGEEYHQDYLDKHPNGYCHIHLPK